MHPLGTPRSAPAYLGPLLLVKLARMQTGLTGGESHTRSRAEPSWPVEPTMPHRSTRSGSRPSHRRKFYGAPPSRRNPTSTFRSVTQFTTAIEGTCVSVPLLHSTQAPCGRNDTFDELKVRNDFLLQAPFRWYSTFTQQAVETAYTPCRAFSVCTVGRYLPMVMLRGWEVVLCSLVLPNPFYPVSAGV